MVARLLRATVFILVSAALAWLGAFWRDGPVLAVTGALFLLGSYTVPLMAEIVALWRTGRRDAAPAATGWELVWAWGRESVAAARVFGWRQAFFPDRVPDALVPGGGAGQARGVVFLSGFLCNRGFWTPWLVRVREQGRVYVAVNLEPLFGSIDDFVPLVDAAVARVTAATGLAPVIVCHSMGGLAARAWLKAMNADQRVHHVVTIGSPHHGTWLGRFSGVPIGQQMRLNSSWLRELARHEPPDRMAKFTCWYSNCDNVVFPTSTATLLGAQNRFVRGVPHVALAFCPQVMEATLEALQGDCYEDGGARVTANASGPERV